MEVNIGPDLQAKLARLATERGRDTQALVEEAIERFVDYDECCCIFHISFQKTFCHN